MKKGLSLNGRNPTLIYGYGGFGVTVPPKWNPFAAAWLELGGVYASTHLRGGGELGTAWHRAGMRERKQNTFDDLYAAAEWLIENGYTSPEHLGVMGNSNGGLLVGAAITQRPELWNAAICDAALLDMLRFHQSGFGAWWIDEYGCSDRQQDFENLIQYSPYHNVRAGKRYPAVLFSAGAADAGVLPWHSRKMTAMMQAKGTSDSVVLLREHAAAGHSGGMPQEHIISTMVEKLALLKWRLF